MSELIAIGSKVKFKPGPKATSHVEATVISHAHPFLVTRDAAGKERKVRNGAAKAI